MPPSWATQVSVHPSYTVSAPDPATREQPGNPQCGTVPKIKQKDSIKKAKREEAGEYENTVLGPGGGHHVHTPHMLASPTDVQASAGTFRPRCDAGQCDLTSVVTGQGLWLRCVRESHVVNKHCRVRRPLPPRESLWQQEAMCLISVH